VHETTHVSLLQRLARGRNADSSAWDEFYERYGDLIRGYARARGLQPTDCDDVVQDVLLALTRAMPGFEYDPGKGRFRGYLRTMVVHAVHRKSFQRRGERALEDAAAADLSDGGDADDQWETQWRQHHLRLAMRTVRVEFNAADLAAFDAYAVEGRSAGQTAETLSMTVEQVYQAKSRILRRLGVLVAQQVQEEG
jgi:RNA polymerase sigma-70 factor (ECF subfamily)